MCYTDLVGLYTDKIAWRIKMEIITGLITFIVGSCMSVIICLLPLIIVGIAVMCVLGALNSALTGKR